MSVLYFLIELIDSLESNFLSSFYMLDTSPLSDVGLVKIFSQSGLLFCPIDSVLCLTEAFFVGPICQLLILEQKALVLCSGKFPLGLCVQGSSPFSLLVDSAYLVLCGGP